MQNTRRSQTTTALRRRRRRIWLVAAVVAVLAITVAYGFLATCEICTAAYQIILRGTVAQNCTINVVTDAQAQSLPLAATGAQHVRVGIVSQACNKKVGYTLTVASDNCPQVPTGAKVSDAISGESLSYSTEFGNPTTGGSQAAVTGLLANACGNQIGRDVTNAKIQDEQSVIFVNFTGSNALAAGTYQDMLTITMNVK